LPPRLVRPPPPVAAAEIVAQAVRGGVLALAAEQVGGAQRCLDMAVAYAKVRHQFGRAIGSFQAIKHICADMLLEVESARSAAYYAAWAAADGAADLPLVASLAKAYCSEAYFHVAASNIQVHGGIGFTWEHDAHLYYRRAKSAEVMLGTPASHREVIAGLLLKDAAGLTGPPRDASRHCTLVDIYIYGSLSIVRALLAADLVDELVLMIEPITLGGGKTLFPSDGQVRTFELISAESAATGVQVCRYRPTR
jgi:hypothetical protein